MNKSINITKNNSLESIVIIGVFTAMAAVISALPIGFNILGVPATLQTFAMSFLGFVLGSKKGSIAVAIYILIGFIGVPVYSQFTAGPSILFGMTGGFLFGFIPLAFICGLSYKFKNPIIKIIIPITGLFICHGIGIIQFSLVTDMKIAASLAAVSLPYIPKDILSVFLSYIVAISIRKALKSAKIKTL